MSAYLPNKVYTCAHCKYETINKSYFKKHLCTFKHNINAKNNAEILICKKCGKIYKHRSSLWRHKKSCNYNFDINSCMNSDVNVNYESLSENENICMSDENSYIDNDLIIKLIDENKELKNLLLEQAKQTNEIRNIMAEMKENNKLIVDNSPVTVNYNTTKTFNLNIFLNETCKNAMNLKDFMDSIQLELSDLINVGQVGYIRGISDIPLIYPTSPTFIKSVNSSCIESIKSFKFIAFLHVSFKNIFKLNVLFVL